MEFGYGVLIWILSLALLLRNNINCNEFGVGDHARHMHLVLTVMLNHSMTESNHTAIPTANSNTTNISPQKDVTSTSQGNENTDCLTTTTACPTTTNTCPTTTTTTCEPIPEHMATDPIPENLNKPAKTLLTLNDCASLPDNTVLTDSRHCRRFYVCQRGRVKRQRCSLTQWYDREALTCRDRKLVTNCPANKS